MTNNTSYAGGIWIERTELVTVKNSDFSANESVFFGGGIACEFSVEIEVANSTISNNSSGISGGVGVYGCEAATLTNCSIFGNRSSASFGAGGGFYGTAADNIYLDSCTITGNHTDGSGGGISLGFSNLLLSNSIVAFNTDDDGFPDIEADVSSLFSSLNFGGPNLFSDVDAGLLNGAQIVETDPAAVFATTAVTNGILTGVLADNGGSVSTVLILEGGVAEDAGLNSGLAPDIQDLDEDGDVLELTPVDARGFLRIANGTTDLGAVEFTASNDTQEPSPELCFEEVDSGGSAVLSFELNQTLEAGESWVLSRATDLVGFGPIFTFDGTSVTSEEAGNSSNLDVGTNTFTITDANPPLDRAFYRLEIASD